MNPRPSSSLRGLLAAFAVVLTAGHGLAQTPPDPPMTVIEMGESWRYLDTGAVPPALGGVASWRAPNYNAEIAGSPWKVGFGLFGYGDNINYGQAISFGPNANAKFITTYFWKRFQLPPGAAYTPNANAPGLQFKSFELGIIRDDAVAVYVNGLERLLDTAGTRDNLPSFPTAIINTTLASGPLDGDSETTTVTRSYSGEGLVKFEDGFNVIGVEVHQSINTTPDMRFDLFLNLTDADPCYGAARPGIKLGFQNPATGSGGFLLHEREPLGEPPFDDQDTEMNWKSTDVATAGPIDSEAVNGALLPSTALHVAIVPTTVQFDSEPIDLRNFTNVAVTAKVQAYKRPGSGAYSNGDRIEFTLRYSGDGTTYRDLPWQTISTSATSSGTIWTDLVGENAEKKAIVPTTDTNPLNVGLNNWRTRGFSDAAWPTGTNGVGYENNPGDATNYTSLIDGSFNFQTQLYGASPKKSVAYMRATFPAQPNKATFTKLQLRVKYDDGFIAYLNDVEVARENVLPTVTHANITPTTLASAGNADTNAVLYKDIDITSKLTHVDIAQPNVLAVYVLNTPADSSDMIVWPVLQIGKAGGPAAITLANIDDGDASTYTTISTANAGPGGTSLIPPNTQAIKIRFKATVATATTVGFYFDDIEVIGTPIAADSYDTFIRVAAPAASPADLDAKADLDGDSIPNICEYGFVSNPTVAGLFTPDRRPGKDPTKDVLPITPEVIYNTPDAHVLVKFRVPSGAITGNAGDGYEVLDLNIRPQMSFGEFTESGWQDAVSGTSKFAQFGFFEENNDGSVTVTCRSLDPVDKLVDKILFVRVRVGVTYPSYLAGPHAECPF